jgi:hypothetical protein
LGLIVIVAVLLAWIAKERRQSWYEQQVALQLLIDGFDTAELRGPFDSYPPNEPQGWWRDAARRLLGERIFYVATRRNDKTSSIPPLLRLTNLQSLSLNPLQECDVASLCELQDLVSLNIVATGKGDLAPLPRLANLEYLNVFRAERVDLTPLARLTNLKELQIHTREGCDFASVAGLTNLKRLYIVGTPVTREQIDALQTALPHCKIEHDPFPEP